MEIDRACSQARAQSLGSCSNDMRPAKRKQEDQQQVGRHTKQQAGNYGPEHRETGTTGRNILGIKSDNTIAAVKREAKHQRKINSRH